MNPDQRRALALGTLATLLYLATAPAVPNLDGLGYLKLLPHNFAPGHLAWMPLLRATTRLLHGDGLQAGRLLDALLGGSGVVLMYGFVRRTFSSLPLGRPFSVEDSRFAATFAAAGLAVSYGYWSAAADLEAYAASLVALLAVVRLTAAYRAQPTLARALGAGALLGLAVLCHMTHVLLTPFVAAALIGFAGERRRGAIHAALALALGGALSLSAYRYAAFVVRRHDLAGALSWVGSASHGFLQGGGPYKLADAVYGLAKSVVWSPYLYEDDAQKLVGQLLLGLIPLVALGVALVASRRALPAIGWRIGLFWIVPYATIGVLFFGSDPERWVFILPALWLAAAVVVALQPRRARIGALVVVFLLAANFATGIWPAHRDERVRKKAQAAAAALRDGDLLVFPGHSWDEYVPFYAGRRVEPFPIAYYAARDGADDCFDRLGKDVARVRAAGGRTLALRILEEHDDDPRGWDELMQLGVSRATVRARTQALSIVPVPRDTTAQ